MTRPNLDEVLDVCRRQDKRIQDLSVALQEALERWDACATEPQDELDIERLRAVLEPKR